MALEEVKEMNMAQVIEYRGSHPDSKDRTFFMYYDDDGGLQDPGAGDRNHEVDRVMTQVFGEGFSVDVVDGRNRVDRHTMTFQNQGNRVGLFPYYFYDHTGEIRRSVVREPFLQLGQ